MKKQWISVKCGLSRDPKHRQAMGESVWLFLHILDIASWEDGIAHDWKDEAAAEDMGMPVRTLREHRRKLSELGYISCNQKQYTQDIVIHNWTNPREYNGQVYNEKQGSSETSPQKNEQGYTQGYTQGNRKDVTPTLDSNIKESIGDKSPDLSKMPMDWKLAHGQEITADDVARLEDDKRKDAANLISIGFGISAKVAFNLAYAFQVARNITFPESKVKGQRKAIKEMLEMHVTPENVTEAVQQLTGKGMTVVDLFSVSKTAIDLANKPDVYNPNEEHRL